MSEQSANEWQMVVVLIIGGYVGFYLALRRWGPSVRYYLALLTSHYRRAGDRSAKVKLAAPKRNRAAVVEVEGPDEMWSARVEHQSTGKVVVARNGKVLHPAQVWVPALLTSMAQDRLPHLLIVGESRGGKTTVARAIMSCASNSFGARLVILDPHTKEGDYPVAVIGRHRNFGAINQAMQQLMEEFNWRFDQDRHDHEPLLIFIDEWPSIADSKECPLAAEFLQTLAREAGKIHMHLFILTTSPLVEDLKVNSATRRNFSKVMVGYYAKQLVPEAFTKKERYATALEHKGQKLALGSQDTREVAGVPIAPGCLWQPKLVRHYASSLAENYQVASSPGQPPRTVLLHRLEDSVLPEKVAVTPVEIELGVELKEGEVERALRVEAEQYIKVTLWLMEKPQPSAREVARWLYGKDGGRYTMRALEIMGRVRKLSEGGTDAGGTEQNGAYPASN